MAEYYAVLSKAVAGLDANSSGSRRAVYDKARNALIGQLKAIDPPLPTAEISRQRLELEEAIRRVEREAASIPTGSPVRVARPQPAPTPTPEPAIAGAPPAAAQPTTARQSPQDIFRKAIRQAERDVAEEPRLERAPVTAKLDPMWTAERADRVPPAPPPAPRAAAPVPPPVARSAEPEPTDNEPRLAPEYDHEWEQPPMAPSPIPEGAMALDDDEFDRPARGRRGRRAAREVSDAARAKRPSRLPTIIVLVLIVAVLGGVGALAWSQRDMIMDLASGLLQESGSGTGGVATTADVAPAADDSGLKDTDRLLSGGEQAAETDVRVVSPPAEGPEGQPVATASLEAPAFAPVEEEDLGTDALVAQRAVLYEEPFDAAEAAAGVVAINAAVTWSYVANGVNGPEVVANLDVPERNLKLKVAIRRNTDATLPASHIVEVVLDVPPDFPGRGVRDIPRIVFKPTEDARGQPLIGASAQVAPGFFWIALSGVDVDVRANQSLLSERLWIDLPLVYESGQRAILTFEKGNPGERVFERALAAWAG